MASFASIRTSAKACSLSAHRTPPVPPSARATSPATTSQFAAYTCPVSKCTTTSRIRIAALGNEASPMQQAVIKVIGVGGGGSNVVNRMIEDDFTMVESWVVNTDAQALVNATVAEEYRIQIGEKSTRGLGAGGNPEIGLMAATESQQAIEDAVRGADMLFVTAGLGGGTGSGAAPLVCQIAKDMGILTVAFVTMPFNFEGKQRMKQARQACELISKFTDTVVVVPNERLLHPELGGDLPLSEAFRLADSVLVSGVRGICDIILVPGMVNVDFADVKSIMHCAGNSLMSHGSGTGSPGKGRTIKAAQAVINSPLLECGIHDATGVVWNITGPPDLGLAEMNEAANIIQDVVDEDANIIFGAVFDPKLKNEVHITLIATGFTKQPPGLQQGQSASPAQLSSANTSSQMAASSKSAVSIPSFLQSRRRAT